MPESLLSLLKLCLLALLYLFFFRVLWAVWNEVRGPKLEGAVSTTPSRRESKKAVVAASRLVMKAPAEQKGKSFALGRELTVGRAGGCHVALPDDTFVSQLTHACTSRTGSRMSKISVPPTAPISTGAASARPAQCARVISCRSARRSWR